MLSATLHEQPPALAGDAAVVALDRLIRRALAKRPAERPASAAEVLAELGAIPLGDSSAGRSMARPLTRLAVLPFRLLRPDPEIDFLSFALADAVSASLAGLPGIVLRSSAAVSRFAGDAPDLKALASHADVDHALIGTLLRAGEQLRVSTQLVETPAGTLVSTQTLQAAMGDVFSLQDELSQRIVESLSPSLALGQGSRRRGAPASARAYEFYLRANEVVRDLAQIAVARDLYRQSVDADPSFAPAWAKLGRCHRLLAKYHRDRPAENVAQAETCFKRALELDPELPVAHKLYAHHEAEMGHAREAMVRLLGLARSTRNDPEIFAALVHACRYCGLLDASEAAHREARRLDPHIWTSVVYTWWARGEMERLTGETFDATGFQLRSLALEGLGRRAEALRNLEAVSPTSLAPVMAALRTGLLGLLRDAPDAVAGFTNAVSAHTDPEAHLMYATIQGHFGEPELAFGSLVAAVDGGFTVPQALREHPWLASVRQGGRLDALAERAEARRREAESAFRDEGGEALLGAL